MIYDNRYHHDKSQFSVNVKYAFEGNFRFKPQSKRMQHHPQPASLSASRVNPSLVINSLPDPG